MRWRKIDGWLLTAAAFLTVVSILDSLWIPGFMSWLTPATTLLTFSFALLHAGLRLGWPRAILMAVVVFIISIGFESVGVLTGAIYGPYHYTDQLGIKFLGLVPLLIPVAWFMMMYASYVIAGQLIPALPGANLTRLLVVAALGGLAMTAWDLTMDPLMVAAGHWVWNAPGAYFGIPLQNFWGWWLTTFTALTVYQLLAQVLVKKQVSKVDLPPLRWVVYAYILIGGSSVIVASIFDLQGPALSGLFAMLPWAVVGLLRT